MCSGAYRLITYIADPFMGVDGLCSIMVIVWVATVDVSWLADFVVVCRAEVTKDRCLDHSLVTCESAVAVVVNLIVVADALCEGSWLSYECPARVGDGEDELSPGGPVVSEYEGTDIPEATGCGEWCSDPLAFH